MSVHHVEFELKAEDIVALQRLHATQSTRKNWFRLAVSLTALYLIACGLVIKSNNHWGSTTAVMIDMATVAFPMGLIILIVFVKLRKFPEDHVKKLVKDGHAHRLLGPRTCSISPAGFHHVDGSSTTTVAWQGIQRTHRTAEHLFLYTQPTAAFIVPARAFATSSDFDGFALDVERFRHDAPPYESRCPKCGYDLTGALAGCPECGWRREVTPASPN